MGLFSRWGEDELKKFINERIRMDMLSHERFEHSNLPTEQHMEKIVTDFIGRHEFYYHQDQAYPKDKNGDVVTLEQVNALEKKVAASNVEVAELKEMIRKLMVEGALKSPR